jgi:hypothetical protein
LLVKSVRFVDSGLNGLEGGGLRARVRIGTNTRRLRRATETSWCRSSLA